jgi:hypothetical protein
LRDAQTWEVPGLCYVGQIDSLGGAVKMLDTWLPNVVILHFALGKSELLDRFD